MKERVREAMFNLIGPPVKGTHVVDLFGGTGAVALEAISRGALSATIIERHYPTAKIIRENVASLAIEDVDLITSDTFYWARQENYPPQAPWLVTCCPPYVFYTERADAIWGLVNQLIEAAPPHSMFVVEATPEYDYGQLPHAEHWDVRTYSPAVIGLLCLNDLP